MKERCFRINFKDGGDPVYVWRDLEEEPVCDRKEDVTFEESIAIAVAAEQSRDVDRVEMLIPKSDAEHVNAKDANGCPICGSDQVEGGHVDINSTEAWQGVSCLDCGYEFNEVYTLAMYETSDAREPDGKPKGHPHLYLVAVVDDTEPLDPIGPFPTPEERDETALALRASHGRDTGVYKLDFGYGTPRMSTYSGGFFTDGIGEMLAAGDITRDRHDDVLGLSMS